MRSVRNRDSYILRVDNLAAIPEDDVVYLLIVVCEVDLHSFLQIFWYFVIVSLVRSRKNDFGHTCPPAAHELLFDAPNR